MQRHLTLEFIRVTEAAALAASNWVGKADKNSADAAATNAMRQILGEININGQIVIGEGEMDQAPMLYIGEKVGLAQANSPLIDIAVDPLEGTQLVAQGGPGAITVLAAAPKGGLLHAPDVYMNKICVGPGAATAIDLDLSVTENLEHIASALGKPVCALTVAVLERPRHQDLIAEIRAAGSLLRLFAEGDVAYGIAPAIPHSGIDALLGIGGAPEGVLAAAALKCLGGNMHGRLELDYTKQEVGLGEIHLDFDPQQKLSLEMLVPSPDVIFAATGITESSFLPGITVDQQFATLHSVVMRSQSGTIRWLKSTHRSDRKCHWQKYFPSN